MDKIEVARRQLGTALALFLNDHEPVSVHTLTCAAWEILEHQAEQAGREPFRSYALKTFPEHTTATLTGIMRIYCNAFKHARKRDRKAEREDAETLAAFSDEVNDHALFIGWYDYGLATGALPAEAQAFQIWYSAKHPDGVTARWREIAEGAFPNIDAQDRSEQKRCLRVFIETSHASVINDPKTDPRPLSLGANLGS